MKDLRDRVAVVTGGASGIGLALARRLGAEGARVVLADIDADGLGRAVVELEKEGVDALGVPTDVRSAEQVRALADRTLEHFGRVHLVFNNAGVFGAGLCWESSLEDYEWVLGVNVWGVIHGIRTFVPILLEQGEEAHVVNTASMAGVTAGAYTGIYFMSKHAVVSLSETLYHELTLRGAKVGVSVLCPELVSTRIDQSERNRPDALRGSTQESETAQMVWGALSDGIGSGVPPAWIADRTLEAIREGRFYILADDADWRRCCETRLDDIRLGRNPTFSVPSS